MGEILQVQPTQHKKRSLTDRVSQGWIKFQLILPFIFLISGCKQDIPLHTEGLSIPLVYAILDASDSVHYVKLGKTFSGEQDVEALLLTESLHYENARVSLHRLHPPYKIVFAEENMTGKNTGLFPLHPNPVYAYRGKLAPGSYLLKIVPDASGDTLSKEIQLFEDLSILNPGRATKRIYFYDDPISFIWTSSSYGIHYELSFELTYEEATADTLNVKTIIYTRNILESEMEWMQDRWKFRLYSDPFFGHIGKSIQDDPAIRYRKPTNLRLIVSVADPELTFYLNNIQPDTPLEPDYQGNIQGAIGIAAAKNSQSRDHLILSPKAMDSLKSGRFTKNHKFISNPDW